MTPNFSRSKLTSIEQYAYGTHYGCDVAEEEVVPGANVTASYLRSSSRAVSIRPVVQRLYFNSYIKGNLTPELMNTYAQAEKETGVPCEILAFTLSKPATEGSLVSGRKLGDSRARCRGQSV